MTVEQERREASALADASREAVGHGEADDPGLVCCECVTVWCKVGRLRGLADLDCPTCGAMYGSIGFNAEP